MKGAREIKVSYDPIKENKKRIISHNTINISRTPNLIYKAKMKICI